MSYPRRLLTRLVCRVIDVRTATSPETGQQKVRGDPEQPADRIKVNRGGKLQRHLLELCQERQREVSRATGAGDGDGVAIGTLKCATLVYVEKNWLVEVRQIERPSNSAMLTRYSAFECLSAS